MFVSKVWVYISTETARIKEDTYQNSCWTTRLSLQRSSRTKSKASKDCNFTIIFSKISKQYEYAFDAIALIRASNKLSLFITFTCNPKEKEIVSNLGFASQSNFFPEFIARVFKSKLKELMTTQAIWRRNKSLEKFLITHAQSNSRREDYHIVAFCSL